MNQTKHNELTKAFINSGYQYMFNFLSDIKLKQIPQDKTMKTKEEIDDIFKSFGNNFNDALKISELLFGHEPRKDYLPEDCIDLGEGFYLKPLIIKDNRNKYSYLYFKGQQLSTEIFRQGGMSRGFKDGYCMLIHYIPRKPTKENPDRFSSGIHCIIDKSGAIIIESSKNTPYHIKGCIASVGKVFYNLKTGEIIGIRTVDSYIDSRNLIIFEHRYDFDCYKMEFDMPLGIYQINVYTGEVTKLDDIK